MREYIKIYAISGGKNDCCSELESRINGMENTGVVGDWYLYREVRKASLIK